MSSSRNLKDQRYSKVTVNGFSFEASKGDLLKLVLRKSY